MLLSDDVARLRGEFGTELSPPRSILKCLSRPGCFLNRRDVLPGLVVARTVTMMHRIENAQPNLSRSDQQLQHIRYAAICFGNALDAIPYLAALRYEIVVGIDDEKCRTFLFKLQVGHGIFSYAVSGKDLFLKAWRSILFAKSGVSCLGNDQGA